MLSPHGAEAPGSARGGQLLKHPLRDQKKLRAMPPSDRVLVPAQGTQRDRVERHVPFKTWVRTCKRRWAPRSLQRICCFFTKRLLTTWLTADSVNPVEMALPCRYRAP